LTLAAPVVHLGGGVEFVEGRGEDGPDLSVILEEELPLESLVELAADVA
jgi:hypothetical protein